MKRNVRLLLEDILENIELIEESTAKMDKQTFLRDKMLQNAIVRCIEIIGEAAKNIPDHVKERFVDVKWKDIIGTRDVVAHAYFKVDLDIVWEIAKKKVPELKRRILKIKKGLDG